MAASQSPKPRRRWFQFSLRSLLVLVTVFAVWLGLQVNRANRQRRAVEAISAMGGQFSYDYQRQPKRPSPFPSAAAALGIADPLPHSYNLKAEPPGPAWLRKLIGAHYFIAPVRLRINDQRVVDEDGLRYLRDLSHLEELSLGTFALRPQDLDHLKNLTKLRLLQLGIMLEDDAGQWDFDALSRFRELRVLSASGSYLKGSDLAHLRAATDLRQLFAYRTEINDEGLAHLKGLKNLEMLGLADTAVTDDGLEQLAKLPNLVYLSLNNTALTDVGLEHLAKIRSLRELELYGTRVTADGIEQLRTALPNCRVQCQFPPPNVSPPVEEEKRN